MLPPDIDNYPTGSVNLFSQKKQWGEALVKTNGYNLPFASDVDVKTGIPEHEINLDIQTQAGLFGMEIFYIHSENSLLI